jgi:hypothetical protein
VGYSRSLDPLLTDEDFGTCGHQRRQLVKVINALEQLGIYRGLRAKLDRYLEQDDEVKHYPGWPRDYMKLMAELVADAVETRRTLYIATLERSPEAFATFSMEEDGDDNSGRRLLRNGPRERHIVSSGATDSDGNICQSKDGCRSEAFAIFVKGLEAGREEVAEEKFCVFTSVSDTNSVSTIVELAESASKLKLPLVTNTRWINGLTFYKGMRPQKIVVPWPEAWQ